jgi:hypothetical protein
MRCLTGTPLTAVYKTLLLAKRVMEDESAYLRSFGPQRCDLLAVTYQRLAWMYRKCVAEWDGLGAQPGG